MLAILLTLLLDVSVQTRPAQIAEDKGKSAKSLKIFATAPWSYVRADPDGPRDGQQFVIRTAKELAARPPFSDLDARPEVVEKHATAALAKALKVDTIDWDKQMLVVVTGGVKPTGGYRVEIVSVSEMNKALVVQWQLHTPKGAATQAFTHPALVALVERYAGDKIVFQEGRVEKPKIRPVPPPKPSDLPANAAPQNEEKAKDGKDVKILAQASARIGVARTAGHQVVRSAEELVKAMGGKTDADKATAQVAKLLKVDHIDWKKHMVIVVSGDMQRTGGYSVQVNHVKLSDKTLTVEWKLNTPKAGQPVTQAITYPAATILVERFEGTVRFDPPAAKSKGELREKVPAP